MPSKNSINRPKDKLIRNGHASAIGKKRSARSRLSVATRSSTSRYNTDEKTATRPSESKSLALYSGTSAKPSGVITNNTLSKKRSKKIARNQKYTERRNEKLSIDVAAKQEEAMEIDGEAAKEKATKGPSKLEQIKQALWAVVADGVSEGMSISGDGNGTTLGVQAF